MMAGISDAAIALGIPCFPCGQDKRPVVATGFKAASVDPAQIRAAFERPGAQLIGVPTGHASGWVVIDIDIRPDRDGNEWLERNADALPPTRTHKTRSGGLHLIFKMPEGIDIRNSAGRVAPGVDVRGTGGYVIVPPSPGYSLADPTEPADMPRWLIRACMPPEREQRAPVPLQPAREHGGSAYGLKALADECNAIRQAAFGQQEMTLNSAALKIGALVAGGELEESLALADLLAAGRSMSSESGREAWQPDEVDAKVRRAFRDGQGSPRKAPERPIQYQTPETPGEQPMPTPAPEQAPDTAPLATSFSAAALGELEPYEWVYGRFLCIGYMSLLGAPSGAGKTTLLVAIAISIATGKPILGEDVGERQRVWLINTEDDKAHLMKLIWAACQFHGIEPAELEGWLFLTGADDTDMLVATRAGDRLVHTPKLGKARDFIIAQKIRVSIVDPFVDTHGMEENNNEQMNFAARTWYDLARDTRTAIAIGHHFRKGGQSGEQDSFRGAVSLMGKSRVARTIGVMSPEEATKLGVSDNQRPFHLRLDNAKSNLSAPASEAHWMRLESVDLSNGDCIGTLRRWEPPSAFEGLTWGMIGQILDRIERGPEEGEMWTLSRRGRSNERWAGNCFLGIADKTDGQKQSILSQWAASGVLEEGEYHSPKTRKTITCVSVNRAKVAEMRAESGGQEWA